MGVGEKEPKHPFSPPFARNKIKYWKQRLGNLLRSPSNTHSRNYPRQVTISGCGWLDPGRQGPLLAGEPTEIHPNLNIQAVTSMDKLAAMLGQSLIDDPRTIDVSPDKEGNGG